MTPYTSPYWFVRAKCHAMLRSIPIYLKQKGSFLFVIDRNSFFLGLGQTVDGVPVCATYTSCSDGCGWDAQISVKKCWDNSFRYKLVVPEACPVGYCAGDFADCPNGQLWDPDNNLCIGTYCNFCLSVHTDFLLSPKQTLIEPVETRMNHKILLFRCRSNILLVAMDSWARTNC